VEVEVIHAVADYGGVDVLGALAVAQRGARPRGMASDGRCLIGSQVAPVRRMPAQLDEQIAEVDRVDRPSRRGERQV
jgi:hypothetical protein